MNKKAKAILLLSGGLDSTLVGAILKRENIEVLALRFVTGLEYSVIKEELLEIYSEDPAKKAADFLNIPIRFVSLKDVYLDMFLNPKYGYGSAINPCLDCHILMLKTAKKIRGNIQKYIVSVPRDLANKKNGVENFERKRIEDLFDEFKDTNIEFELWGEFELSDSQPRKYIYRR